MFVFSYWGFRTAYPSHLQGPTSLLRLAIRRRAKASNLPSFKHSVLKCVSATCCSAQQRTRFDSRFLKAGASAVEGCWASNEQGD